MLNVLRLSGTVNLHTYCLVRSLRIHAHKSLQCPGKAQPALAEAVLTLGPQCCFTPFMPIARAESHQVSLLSQDMKRAILLEVRSFPLPFTGLFPRAGSTVQISVKQQESWEPSDGNRKIPLTSVDLGLSSQGTTSFRRYCIIQFTCRRWSSVRTQ